MGWFNKKKKFKISDMERNDAFLKDCAITINGLRETYAKDNQTVNDELVTLTKNFEFTVGSGHAEVKAIEKQIRKLCETLEKILEQPSWNEDEVILTIQKINMQITKINRAK